MDYIHVAIDGPAGAGKSTIAKAVAKALRIPYLDTGAMYRTLALYAIRAGVDPRDEAGVGGILPGADIRIAYDAAGMQHMLVQGEDVTGYIRTNEVSKGASDIGVHPAVRKKLVQMQQQVAAEGPVVMDGRDICTVVMPHAPHKFFVTASPRIRAERRRKEFLEKGQDAPSIEELEQAIIARDATDSGRACDPLRQTEDAMLIDTSNLTIEESIQTVLRAIEQKVAAQNGTP
ncbi:(d)CMP kinase [Christensenellaceae bacterium OttesenSCG-928-L17]|nr:(d)CMP kinase [Christensenellaceae bacterium OttesenSCG-928-L17]